MNGYDPIYLARLFDVPPWTVPGGTAVPSWPRLRWGLRRWFPRLVWG